ncbi:MAG: carboxymuconolactone decarboxylase family protein [Myxococcales bacterium]|nr:carboxymuconolactone decarboxylase family protein [Myxococcales bacterium]
MNKISNPPKAYSRFVNRFSKLGDAWELMNEAGSAGPLDGRTQRLIKLAVAMGAMREGNVHSGVRKALADGISVEELEQCVALAASTLGMPSTVAVFSWICDEIDKAETKGL